MGMHYTTALLLCLSVAQHAWALTPMPDPNLRAWVNNNFPGAIVGTSIDETHPDVQSATYIDISFQGNVTDLMGIEAFANATTLDVSNNPIATWMGPAGLQILLATNCGITGSFTVPWMLMAANLAYNNITTLDISNASQLSSITAHHNQITTVLWPSNNQLSMVDLSYNQLTTLGSNLYLPWVNTLRLQHNQLTAVPYGWNGLTYLDASWNQITDLSQLHGSDYNFFVNLSHNAIQHVPHLSTAESVDLSFNPLTQGIAETGYTLETLRVNDTQLPCLPYLHNALVNLYCTNSTIGCLPNQPPDLVMSATNFGFTPALCPVGDPCHKPDPSLALRVFLQGPFDFQTFLMNDDLRAQNLLPTNEPYSNLGFTYAGNGWPDTLDPALFNVSGPDAIVDWVVVDALVNTGVLNPLDAVHYSRPALVQRDGDVVALDGSSPIPMHMPYGSYRVAVRHRNHLGAIVKFGDLYKEDPVTVDFTDWFATACFANALHGDSLFDPNRQLWSGDVTFNHQLKYVGTTNDRDPVLQAIGGVLPQNTVSGVYANEDVNMDGVIKYVGVRNDRDPILQNVGGFTPNAVRNQIGF